MRLFDDLMMAQTDPTAGRVLGSVLGIVTANDDPMGLNRIKVTTGDKGGLSETYWVMCLGTGYGITLPRPRIGSTVVLGFLNADPHLPVYLGVLHNGLNVPQGTDSVIMEVDSEVGSIIFKVGSTQVTISDLGVTINGKQVAVVGAKDSRNDTIILICIIHTLWW
jgi:Type VI secretion system/phage-baseplate injector OB domain